MQSEIPPPLILLGKLMECWQVHAMRACCELGVPDTVNAGPLAVEEIAARTGADTASLYRVMRALASSGVFVETGPRTFGHSPLSGLLREDIPGSFRWMLLSEIAPERHPAWINMSHSIRTGGIAFDHLNGQSIWEFYRENPVQGDRFSRWMTGASYAMTEAIHAAFDFSPFPVVADIAGGQGVFLASVLDRHASHHGILFDLPEVIGRAIEHPRMTRVGGSFFEAVPEGADLYTLKWIIHDWEESKAVAILRNVRRAMKPGAKLMLIEGVVAEGTGPDPVKWMDINMMVMAGGRERTAAEYGSLLAESGFRVEGITPTASMPCLIVAGPA